MFSSWFFSALFERLDALKAFIQGVFNSLTLKTQAQHAQMLREFSTLSGKVDLLMSTAQEIRDLSTRQAKEIGEVKELVAAQNSKIDEGLRRIEGLIEQDAADAEIRTALEEELPKMRAGVDELDALTPNAPEPGPMPGEPTEPIDA